MAESDELKQRLADLEAELKRMKSRPANQLGGDIQQASYDADHHGKPTAMSVKGLLRKGVQAKKIQAAMRDAKLGGTILEDGSVANFSCPEYPDCLATGSSPHCVGITYGTSVHVPNCTVFHDAVAPLEPSSERVIETQVQAP